MSKFFRVTAVLALLGAVVLATVGVLTSVVHMYRIETGSMEPTLPTGSLIFITEHADYEAGDIITFHADNGDVVTHRLTGLAENGELLTKGDANPTPDNWNESVTHDDVMGKFVFQIPPPWIGWRGAVILSCVMLFILLALWKKSDDVEEGTDNPAAQEERPETSPV